jgi:hypothetical protein
VTDQIQASPLVVGALLLEQNDEWAVQRALHEPGNHRTVER